MKHAPLLDTNGFNQLARIRDGYCLYNVNDIYIGQAIETYGEYGRIEGQLFDQVRTRTHINIGVIHQAR